MTRLELVAAIGLLVAVCALSCAEPGYVEPAAASLAAEASPFEALLPLQRYSFQVAAVAVTMLGLLLEDGRRRAIAQRHQSDRAQRTRDH